MLRRREGNGAPWGGRKHKWGVLSESLFLVSPLDRKSLKRKLGNYWDLTRVTAAENSQRLETMTKGYITLLCYHTLWIHNDAQASWCGSKYEFWQRAYSNICRECWPYYYYYFFVLRLELTAHTLKVLVAEETITRTLVFLNGSFFYFIYLFILNLREHLNDHNCGSFRLYFFGMLQQSLTGNIRKKKHCGAPWWLCWHWTPFSSWQMEHD